MVVFRAKAIRGAFMRALTVAELDYIAGGDGYDTDWDSGTPSQQPPPQTQECQDLQDALGDDIIQFYIGTGAAVVTAETVGGAVAGGAVAVDGLRKFARDKGKYKQRCSPQAPPPKPSKPKSGSWEFTYSSSDLDQILTWNLDSFGQTGGFQNTGV
jgi:hypothetical protein